jgi:hypothetical protein
MSEAKGLAPKIRLIGTVTPEGVTYIGGGLGFVKFIPTEKDASARDLFVGFNWEANPGEPFSCGASWPNVWIYKRRAFQIEDSAGCSPEELATLIKHSVLKRERQYQRLRSEVAALENLKGVPSARRERIPESVQMFVWQRDQGQCVQCGGRERLEFDHIIPVAEGGVVPEMCVERDLS